MLSCGHAVESLDEPGLGIHKNGANYRLSCRARHAAWEKGVAPRTVMVPEYTRQNLEDTLPLRVTWM